MNPDHKVYDEDNERIPLDRPDLREEEKVSGGLWNPDDKKQSDQDSGSIQNSLHQQETSAQSIQKSAQLSDQPAGNIELPDKVTNRAGNGFNPIEQLSPLGKIAGFLSGHKKSTFGLGGTGIVAVIVAIFGFGGLVNTELVTMEKVMLRYETKIEQHFEQKAASKLEDQIIKVLKNKSGEAADEAEGGELTKDMYDFDIADPAIKEAFASAGLSVETDASGNLIGITNDSGQDVTNKVINGDFDSQLTDALPEWSAGQINDFSQVISSHAGATEEGIAADEPTDEVEHDISSEVLNGTPTNVSETDVADSKDKAASAQLAKEAGSIEGAIQTAESASANGATDSQAVQDGVNSVSLGDPVFIAGAISTGCGIEKSVDEAAKNRAPTIISLLIRHGALLATLADELKTGALNSNVVNKVMSLFSGYASSATWQRATGGTVNLNSKQAGYTPDVEASALPVANSGTKIVESINNALNITGGNLICAALNSPFGSFFQGFAGVVQIVTGDGFGLGGAAGTVGLVGLQSALKYVVLPQIIKYFTPLGINGLEPGAQWMNNAGLGLNLASDDYGRSIGAMPVSMSTANQITATANEQALVTEAKEPWTYKTFALSNPDSLLSKLAMILPTSTSQLFSNISSILTNLPTGLFKSLGSILSPSISADVSSINPGQPEGATPYAIPDSLINKYSATQVDKYFNTNLCVTDNGGHQDCAKRLAMAGDPFNIPSGGSDPSSTDLLHCFVNGYAQFVNDSQPDPICGTMGNYDYNNDPIQPIEESLKTPNVETSYCDYLNSIDSSGISNCIQQVYNQLNDDIGQYQVYLDYAHDMRSLNSLPSSSNDQGATCQNKATTNYYKVCGNRVYKNDGSEFVPYGISIVSDLSKSNWQSTNYASATDAQIQAAASYWHVNTIRLPVSEANFINNPSSQAALVRLGQEVNEIESLGKVPVICDNTELTDPHQHGPTNRTLLFWQAVMNYLNGINDGNFDNIIFDIYNEPQTEGAVWQDGGSYAGQSYIGMQDVVNFIRKQSDALSDNLIWVQGPVTSVGLSQIGKYPIDGDDIVYDYHHINLNDPAGWSQYMGLQAQTPVPIVDGEWAQYASTNLDECYKDAPKNIPSYFTLLKQNHIGLVAWSLEPGSLVQSSSPQPVNGELSNFPTSATSYSQPNDFQSNYDCSNVAPPQGPLGQGAGKQVMVYFANNSL